MSGLTGVILLRGIISARIWTRITWRMRKYPSRCLSGESGEVRRELPGGKSSDQLNRVKDNVALEVQTARLNLLQALEQVKLTGNSLEKAKENETKALERYGEGKTSILEVIDAQTYRENSQLNYVQAKTEAQSYYSGLIKALNAYESL